MIDGLGSSGMCGARVPRSLGDGGWVALAVEEGDAAGFVNALASAVDIAMPATESATPIRPAAATDVAAVAAVVMDARFGRGSAGSPGSMARSESDPIALSRLPSPTARNARTTSGSNCVSAHRASSALAADADSGFL